MTRCPICLSSKFKNIFSTRASARNKGKYQITQCCKCHLGVLTPSLNEEELKQIYQENYFKDEAPVENSDAAVKFQFVRRHLPADFKLLDFGCGVGNFLGICQKEGFFCQGFDMSEFAAKYVSQKYKIPVKTGKLQKGLFPANFFDAIVVFDVIEHISDFSEAIRLWNLWLKKGGTLFITTPNLESLDAKILGRFWYGYQKIPQHLNYFNPDSIKILLNRYHFANIKIRGWGFSRNLEFFAQKLFRRSHIPILGVLLRRINVFFPIVDMMVIAQKD